MAGRTSAPSRPLLAKSYTELDDRRENLDDVRRELNAVINAQPTQVHPTERELYLDALLVDLEEKKGAVWTSWPADVYLLALTAVKSLGRNPVGSETLLTHPHLSTLFFHSVLPFSPPLPFSPQHLSPTSPPAREALKVLANLLVLHAAGRNRFFNAGGAAAVARALAGKGLHGEDVVPAKYDGINTERVFLLARLGFLVTMERPKAVAEMIDEDIVDSLVEQLVALPPLPAHFMALGEVLKLVNNVLHFFPFAAARGSEATEDPWDERLDIFLYPLLSIFYGLPTTTLAPPLSTTINTLLSIPFIPRLVPTWCSIPEHDSLSVSTSTSSPISPATAMRSLLTKLSNMASPSSQPRKLSAEALLPPCANPQCGAGSTPASPRASSSSKRPSLPPVPLSSDPIALPRRLLKVLDGFFEAYLPYPTMPDDTLQKGLNLDDALPPVLLLLTRAAMGCEKMRVWLKETLLPSTLDRSPEAGPLEMRKGILGNVLRLMGSAAHSQTRNSAGELMWAVCKGDAADLCVEIGYGNAAGILFQKGLSGPPPAKIEEIQESAPSSHSGPDDPISLKPELPSHPTLSESGSPVTIQPAMPSASSTSAFSEPLHPITGLRGAPGDQPSLNEMTQAEKEREAERLFVLFERMERNPVISMKSGDSKEKGGEGKKDVKIKELMQKQLEKGNVAEWEKKDEEEERKRQEEEERRDEEQAMKEVEEYRRRTGRK